MADHATRRVTMVDTQVRPSDVTKYPIIEAMLTVPREDYVPDAQRPIAYADRDVPLGEGRIALAPRNLAKLLEASGIGPEDVVLDLACGLGYSSAVLGRMAKAVLGVEPDGARAAEAQALLSRHDADNVAVICGNPAQGEPRNAPYDAIFVNGGIALWPDALAEQLREGGVAVAIWMDGQLGTARLGRKIGGAMIWRDIFNASAPLLDGFEKEAIFAF